MNLEERLEKLELFIGNIDRITSVYANTLQELCDKYLNLLYIEVPRDPENDFVPDYSVLLMDGFLTDLNTDPETGENNIPKNVIFNVKPSHKFVKETEATASKVRFQRTITTEEGTQNIYIDLPLKKFSKEVPDELVFLDDGDYLPDMVYSIYVNSQGIAILTVNDAGTQALTEITEIKESLEEMKEAVNNISTSGNTTTITGDRILLPGNVEVGGVLSLLNRVALPTGSTCSTPDNPAEIANKEYVDSKIDAQLKKWHADHHIFGTGDASKALENAPNKAIYYKYTS